MSVLTRDQLRQNNELLARLNSAATLICYRTSRGVVAETGGETLAVYDGIRAEIARIHKFATRLNNERRLRRPLVSKIWKLLATTLHMAERINRLKGQHAGSHSDGASGILNDWKALRRKLRRADSTDV